MNRTSTKHQLKYHYRKSNISSKLNLCILKSMMRKSNGNKQSQNSKKNKLKVANKSRKLNFNKNQKWFN